MAHTLAFELIRQHRRSISIHIDHFGNIVVKAPYLIPRFLISRFVGEKKEWINKKLKHTGKPLDIKKGSDKNDYLFLGSSYKLEIGDFKKIEVADTIHYPKFLSFRAEKELKEWYISQAKEVISKRVKYYAAILETTYKSISFSDTSSKWGSCSADNALQFNWRLVMSPILVLDYVVVHELVHTREKNHSHDFWIAVAKYKPAYKQYIKWLKENSFRLHPV